MVALQILTSSYKHKKDAATDIKTNWRGLYRKDSQFTYPEATLVLPKHKSSRK